MTKYNITCYLTNAGWQIAHDYSKMTQESPRFQLHFKNIVDTLIEAMKPRDDRPAPFKLKISFCPKQDTKLYYKMTADYTIAKNCPKQYSDYGMEMFSILCDELNLERYK